MSDRPQPDAPAVACDAMCGGLARWLRMLGVDASYRAGITDAELVQHALCEARLVISGDRRLFERRVFRDGSLRGLLIPVGLRLDEQVRFVAQSIPISVAPPRCTRCNGRLERVSRAEVADVVPARSLVWAESFDRCSACGQVYWQGTHWQRIRRRLASFTVDRSENPSDTGPATGTVAS